MTTTTTEQAVRTATRFHRLRYGQSDRALCGVPVRFAVESLPVEDVPDADRCRRCWDRPQGARLERSSMASRVGVRATADGGVCQICDEPIVKEQRIHRRGDRWAAHADCWAGAHE